MGGDGGAGREAARARAEEENRKATISAGTARIRDKFARAFDSNYYDKMEKDYRAAYAPDIKLQYDKAIQQLQAALLQRGLLDSSVYSKKRGDVGEMQANATNEVKQRGIQAMNQRKQDVAFSENSVINQLINTADANASYANTAASIKNTSLPTPTPMLGQVFQDVTAGLATQADLERNNQNRFTLFGRIPGWNASNRYTTTVRGG